MLRIHTDNFVPKYKNGKWYWNSEEQRVEFEKRRETAELLQDEFVDTGIYKFQAKINQIEEMIFRQEFQRPEATHDGDVILIQDIKNLVLYLAPKEIISSSFIKFMHTKAVDKFLHALIIYIEHFLKLVEFIMIRRDDVSGDKAQLQSDESTQIKRIYSEYLTQYRLLVAREYSAIVLGEGELKPYHHLKPVVNISQSIRDKSFYEAFFSVSQQIVWIALHRRAYDIIDAEIGRLFRSEHFRSLRANAINFTNNEMSMLYGINYKRVNYRTQNSPAIQELTNVDTKNLPILWIGERKYRGTDIRLHELELECIVPASQLVLIDVSHGILGHPKKLYNTMLYIDWEAVRYQNYTLEYDPYRIIRQPYLEIPKLDAEKVRKHAKTYESYYQIISYHEPLSDEMFKKWRNREKINNYFKTEGMITSIWMEGTNEINNTSYGPSVDEITAKFREEKIKLRKK